MPIQMMCGQAKPVKDALMDRVRRAQMSGDHPILLIVPAQYTLQAEMEALGEGSFRLQVLSPSRLHARVFDEAGWPPGARIDEQGRVMLVHAAAKRLQKQLGWYQGAVGRRGFAEKVLMQLSGFKQANLSHADIAKMAESKPDGALRRKLLDLALLYEEYERSLAGRFLDGEDEARQAALRMADAGFARGAEVYVYGFDILSQPLSEVLVAMCPHVRHIAIAMNIGLDMRDRDLYAPSSRSRDRLTRLAREAGVEVVQVRIEGGGDYGAPVIRHLMRELFCVPHQRFEGAPRHVQMAMLKNPQDEAEFAASLARQLVMDRGWRWRDLAVMVQNLDDTYMSALRRAFDQAGVPLFLPTSRPADRHPAAQCLLSALRIVTHGWRTEDMVRYLRAGFSGLTDDALDQLVNHILRRGLRGRSLQNPLRNLTEDQLALEAWREHIAQPLLSLRSATKGVTDARAVMTAVFGFMDEIDMCGQLEANAELLRAMGKLEWAMEGAQVYARILQAMDQMVELLSGERLPLLQAQQLLERALSVTQIKPLPQSGDAVQCGGVDHMKSQDAKALLILGLTDQGAPTDGGLLTEVELGELGGLELPGSLSRADRQRMGRMSIKAALSFTEDYLLLCHPMSSASGDAQQAGTLLSQVRRILPGLTGHGGQSLNPADLRMRHMRLNAPLVAMSRLPGMLGETPDDPYLIAVRDALGDDGVEEYIEDGDTLPGDLARQLFGRIDEVSVTRLERYAQCPYQHFARYALRPEEFRAFELTPRDTGDFYHEALRRFVHEHGAQLGELSQAESMERMDGITSGLMDDLAQTALGEGALARAYGEDLRRVARRAAATVVNQLSGSAFRPVALEIDFGKSEPHITISGGARLGGFIDRIDGWDGDGGRYLRVIDYKTNGKTVSFAEIYYGLQMQLMVYLAAATKQHGGKPAGALYFNISDKLVDDDSRDAAKIEEERQKQLKLRGLVIGDEGVYQAMSDHPRDVLPLSGDSKRSGEDMADLMEHTLKKADEMYGELRRGVIARRPAAVGTRVACDVCDYRSICQRDMSAKVVPMPPLRASEVLERIRAESGAD